MSAFIEPLTLACAIGAGVVSGVFFTYSSFTMNGLRRLPAEQGVAAMQAINIEAPKSAPMFLMVATALGCLLLGAYSLLHLNDPGAWYRIAGTIVYIAGTLLLTGGYHVPRNNRLAAMNPYSPEASAHWPVYLNGWTRLNHVRTVAPLAAMLLLLASIAGTHLWMFYAFFVSALVAALKLPDRER